MKQEIHTINISLKERIPTQDIKEKSTQERNETSNILDFHARRDAWQWLWFTPEWDFASQHEIRNSIKEIREWLTIWDDGKLLETYINHDIKAANDEHFPDAEMSDDMILRALRSAKMRKDGWILQSIRNNLVKRALSKSGDPWKQKQEKSIYLTDHIDNIREGKPIRVRSIEFEQFDILNITKTEFEGAQDSYYKAQVRVKNKNIKESFVETFLIRAEEFSVWNFSRSILWIITKDGKFIKSDISCTIRDIESER